jgi:hypothetical protein
VAQATVQAQMSWFDPILQIQMRNFPLFLQCLVF